MQIKIRKYILTITNIKKEAWAWLATILWVLPGIGQFIHIHFPWNVLIGQGTYIGRNTQISCVAPGHVVFGAHGPFCCGGA